MIKYFSLAIAILSPLFFVMHFFIFEKIINHFKILIFRLLINLRNQVFSPVQTQSINFFLQQSFSNQLILTIKTSP